MRATRRDQGWRRSVERSIGHGCHRSISIGTARPFGAGTRTLSALVNIIQNLVIFRQYGQQQSRRIGGIVMITVDADFVIKILMSKKGIGEQRVAS